jgi:serine phosphatase RsbU (regulator of sigma subunit)
MVSVTKAGLSGIPLTSPGEILRQLNLIVKRVNFGRLRMSLNIAKIGTSSVELSSAAMPPTFLYSAENNETNEILEANLPLGGLSGETYDTKTYPFGCNDVLVMVSDGLPELPNDAGEMLDYPRIFDAVNSNANGSADEIKDVLVSLANDWTSAESIPDDITIVVLKRK